MTNDKQPRTAPSPITPYTITMMDPTSNLSVREACHRLGLDDERSTLNKAVIQAAFVRAAKVHHPDGRFHHAAVPCPQRFQQALEAKELLISYYCGGRNTRVKSLYQRHSGFAQGFPHRRLRVLTLKQNLTLRGVVLTMITFGVLYDEWSRQKKHEWVKSS